MGKKWLPMFLSVVLTNARQISLFFPPVILGEILKMGKTWIPIFEFYTFHKLCNAQHVVKKKLCGYLRDLSNSDQLFEPLTKLTTHLTAVQGYSGVVLKKNFISFIFVCVHFVNEMTK